MANSNVKWYKLTPDQMKLVVSGLKTACRKSYDEADVCDKQAGKAVDPSQFTSLAKLMRARADECFDLGELLGGKDIQYK